MASIINLFQEYFYPEPAAPQPVQPPAPPPPPPPPPPADVVFVGAGPVGLWTAIIAKLKNPNLKIVLLEKHDSYQRSHVLQLDYKCFNDVPDDPRLQKLIAEFKKSKYIRTNEIEKGFKNLAEELGIKIIQQDVTEPLKLKEQFPNARVFVGSDGSHSQFREAFFGNEYAFKHDLQYIAEVKYEVHGEARKFKSATKAYRTLKLIKTVATEHIGREKDGVTPVTLRFFISKETYQKMSKATFKNPYNLSTQENTDPTLMQTIKIWLNAKAKIDKELRVRGSEKITVTKLSSYAAKHVFKKIDDNTVCAIVGDAAAGVPFFRAGFMGFSSGKKLADAISAFFSNKSVEPKFKISKKDLKPKDPSQAFDDYAASIKKISEHEAWVASMKNLFIRFYIWFIQISSIVPWQINKWSHIQAQEFKNE